MDLQRGTSLPPFLAAVRRRHPDVDIVVLPPEEPVAAEPVSDHEVAATRIRVDDLTSRAWADATDAPGVPVTRIGYGPHPGTVVAKSRILVRLPAGEHVVEALATVLSEDGWQVGEAPGDAPRFVARRDDLHARASYAEVSGAVLVDVTSGPMPVGTDRARELVRQ